MFCAQQPNFRLSTFHCGSGLELNKQEEWSKLNFFKDYWPKLLHLLNINNGLFGHLKDHQGMKGENRSDYKTIES